jgi:hypothetical protein
MIDRAMSRLIDLQLERHAWLADYAARRDRERNLVQLFQSTREAALPNKRAATDQ